MPLTHRLASGLLLLLLALAPAARAQEHFDVFTIPGVAVDATAANASAARDQALAQGERSAFDLLMARLTPASARGRLPRLSGAQIADLIQGFEVANERRSTVRYLADYTFHFRPDAVRRLLIQNRIPFAETPSKPVLVLPVLRAGAQAVLWDDPNPWRDAWTRAKLPPGLVPVVLPLAEAADVAAIDAQSALSGNDARLRAISELYNRPDVLVAQATLLSGASPALDVTATRYTPGSPGGEPSWSSTVAAQPGESDGDLMTRAVGEIMGRIEEGWKSANILNLGESATLVARVPAAALADWVAVRDRLSGLAAVQSIDLLSIDRSGAQIVVHYLGDPTQLRLALAQRDLVLSGSDPNWVLERRSAGAQR